MSERAERIARALDVASVGLLAGVTGSGFSLQLIDAWLGLGRRYLPACHEGAAAIIAGAHGTVTGGLGAAITIKGPGVANLVPGQVSNAYEGWPVLGISEAYGATRGGRAHKWLDHAALMAGVVKAYGAFGEPELLVHEAARTATAERPGPVHLDVPSDGEPRIIAAGAPDVADATRDVTALVRQAERPVVIVGTAAHRRGWIRDVDWHCPVFTTFAAKGTVDEHQASAAGVFTGDGQAAAPERALIARADLVVGVGVINAEILTPRPFPCPFINFDDSPQQATEGLQPIRSGPGPDGAVVRDALSALRPWGAEPVHDAIEEVHRQLTAGGWTPARAFSVLQAQVPDSRLAVDTGLFCTAAEHVWRARRPGDVLASANGRFMGTSIPMAIGAALADPSRPVICVAGDGGLPPGIAEFRAAIADQLAVVLVLMTDGRFGSVLGVPGARRVEAAATVRQPTWRATIEAMGCPAERAVTSEALAEHLARWSRRGPLFVELAFEPEVYARSTEGVR